MSRRDVRRLADGTPWYLTRASELVRGNAGKVSRNRAKARHLAAAIARTVPGTEAADEKVRQFRDELGYPHVRWRLRVSLEKAMESVRRGAADEDAPLAEHVDLWTDEVLRALARRIAEGTFSLGEAETREMEARRAVCDGSPHPDCEDKACSCHARCSHAGVVVGRESG